VALPDHMQPPAPSAAVGQEALYRAWSKTCSHRPSRHWCRLRTPRRPPAWPRSRHHRPVPPLAWRSLVASPQR
jgi:hypothetical protein